MSENFYTEATAFLCRLMERDDPKLDGKTLFEGEWAKSSKALLDIRLLTLDSKRSSVLCNECQVEFARVVRALPDGQILLLCPECEDIAVPEYLRHVYRLKPGNLVPKLLSGLGFSQSGVRLIDADLLWRLGTSAHKRDRSKTWYFGRRLDRPEVAFRLKEQIKVDNAVQSCVILTSSEMPLPASSPLAGFDVRCLFTTGQLEPQGFVFFDDRMSDRGAQVLTEATPSTTLRYVKTKGRVFLDGEEIALEPRGSKLLAALIDDFDHEMTKLELRDRVESEAKDFSPRKVFDRQPDVYRAFIKFLADEKRYQLKIPDEDRDWLN